MRPEMPSKRTEISPSRKSATSLATLSWLTSVFDELRADWRRAAAPPPCDGDQERKAAEEPGEGGRCVGEQGVARILLAGDRRRSGTSRQRINERQDFAMAGGGSCPSGRHRNTRSRHRLPRSCCRRRFVP